jgi:DNA sulfur modification protein DndB
MDSFAQWAKENPTSLVPPVVLSGRGRWRFQATDETGMGTVAVDDAAAIVDGQHRLGGLVNLLQRHGIQRDIDFLLLPDLALAEEIREFVVLNSSQVGVKRSLTTYLSRDENPDAWVAWELNERPESPFAGRIARQRLETGQLFTLEAVTLETRPRKGLVGG